MIIIFLPPLYIQVLLHTALGRYSEEKPGQAPATSLMYGIRSFLMSNGEMRKMLSRQSLVNLKDFSLEIETSLEGLFGVRDFFPCCLDL